ncbi:hypothetical protein SEVIR_9G337450v4 [Setaria viridis]
MTDIFCTLWNSWTRTKGEPVSEIYQRVTNQNSEIMSIWLTAHAPLLMQNQRIGDHFLRHGSMQVVGNLELDVGLVGRVGLPVGRDDVGGDELLAGLAGDADGEGALELLGRVHPPDGAPGELHRPPLRRRLVLELHLHDVAVVSDELD